MLFAKSLVCLLMVLSAPISLNAENLASKGISSAKASVIEVDELLSKAESLVGKKVTVEGVCTHICSHGATKLFIMGSDESKVIRVQAGKLGSFDTDCKNSMLTIVGEVKETRIDEEYVAKLEAKAAAETSEEEGHSCSHCSSEESSDSSKSNAMNDRIANFRKQISEREKSEGKAYLSYFFLEAEKYDVQ